MWENLPLRIGHVIRRMSSGCKRIVNGILREMSELIYSRTDSRRIFKLGGGIDHVTRHLVTLYGCVLSASIYTIN